MPRYLTIKRINSIAWKVLLAADIANPPVSPYQVAKHLNLEIKEQDLGDISGLLVIRNGKATIGVNKLEGTTDDVRTRFTIAHEIGHFVLGHEKEGKEMFVDRANQQFSMFMRSEESTKGTNPQEIQANAFAAALLMPEPFVRAELHRMIDEGQSTDLSGNDDKFVEKLALKFKVSQMAMTYRLGNLQLFETM